MGLPQRFSGSVVSIASFVIYLPATFAYGLWGWMLDTWQGQTGYQLMFATVATVALAGALLATVLKRRIDAGTSEQIARRVADLDQRLGLAGEERTLTAAYTTSRRV